MIVKEIVERPSSSSSTPPAPPKPPKSLATHGFPVARRRALKSDKADASTVLPPRGGPLSQGAIASGSKMSEVEEVRRAVDEENQRRVQAMSTEEREEEIAELRARFGSKLDTLVHRKRRDPVTTASSEAGPSRVSQPLTRSGPPPATANEVDQVREQVDDENWQKVRGMDQEERQEEIDELQGRFGSKVMDALRARAEKRGKGKEVATSQTGDPDPCPSTISVEKLRTSASEDITPSGLKERYFPNHVSETDKLAWLQPSAPSADSSTRFDLSGRVLSLSDRQDLPTSRGLHHHGTSPDLAGYTLEDVLWLCRSTVASQRITMMGVLARIIHVYTTSTEYDEATRKACEEKEVRTKGMQIGLEVIVQGTRSLGILRGAVDLLYESLGGEGPSLGQNEDGDYFYPDEEETAGISAIPFDEVVPRLVQLLGKDTNLTNATAEQLFAILRRAARHSQDVAETLTPLIPIVARQWVLDRPWPLDLNDPPSTSGLQFVIDCVLSSRVCAQEVVDSDIHASVLKFLVTLSWPEDTSRPVASDLAVEVLRLLSSLGRYGLGAAIATNGSEVINDLGGYILNQATTSAPSHYAGQLSTAYFDVLTIWITCAIDPHKTTPEHALTWSQISNLDWVDQALEALRHLTKADRPSTHMPSLVSAIGTVVAWLKGMTINGTKHDAEEVSRVVSELRSLDLVKAIRVAETASTSKYEVALAGHLLRPEVLFRSIDGVDPVIFSVDLQALSTMTEGRNAELLASREERLLRYGQLDLHQPSLDPAAWYRDALALLGTFQPGDEPVALDLLDLVLKKDLTTMQPNFPLPLTSITHPDGLQILRPLYHHSILPNASHVVGPSLPTHQYLKVTTTLRSPSTKEPALDPKYRGGLPLPPDWLFGPLDELLHSADSTALAQAPPDWTPSEVDLVRATLLMVRLQLDLLPDSMSRSELLFGAMKVFMLEQDQNAPTSEGEAFRDSSISDLLQSLIRLTTFSAQSTSEIENTAETTMETVSERFLGDDTPFFQFYTDFVGLFESISFSDPTFSQLVLPPMAMSYPVDYRKHVWVEQPTCLRIIRTRIGDVPLESASKGMRAFHQPVETDADVLSGYLRALIRGWVTKDRQEFLWSIAVYHLATLFWQSAPTPDNQPSSGAVGKANVVRDYLLKALIGSASESVVKDVFTVDLQQLEAGQIGQASDEEKARRVAVVRSSLGDRAAQRLEVM